MDLLEFLDSGMSWTFHVGGWKKSEIIDALEKTTSIEYFIENSGGEWKEDSDGSDTLYYPLQIRYMEIIGCAEPYAEDARVSALIDKAEQRIKMLGKNIDITETLSSGSLDDVSCVRWLGAFRNKFSYTATEVWNFETQEGREYAAELCFERKEAYNTWKKGNSTDMPKIITRESYISSAKIGLEINLEKSFFIQCHDEDVWSEYNKDGELFATRQGAAFYTTDVYTLADFAKKFLEDRHSELWYKKPVFKNIVVKDYDTLTQKGKQFLEELIKVTGLPVKHIAGEYRKNFSAPVTDWFDAKFDFTNVIEDCSVCEEEEK